MSLLTPSAPYEKSKFLGSGGSMVARLKLKGIDGRAPPGVNIECVFTHAMLLKADCSTRPGGKQFSASQQYHQFAVMRSHRYMFGDTIKLREVPKA